MGSIFSRSINSVRKQFSTVIAELIAGYCAEWELLDWIPIEKLNWEEMYRNPNAFRAGWLDLSPDALSKDTLLTRCRRSALGTNSAAAWYLRDNNMVDGYYGESQQWANPMLFDQLFDEKELDEEDGKYYHKHHCDGWPEQAAQAIGVASHLDYAWVVENTHPRAVEYMIKNIDKWEWELEGGNFCSNPGAIEWLREHIGDRDDAGICGNPEAVDLIKARPKIDYYWLSHNPHPWAIEQLRTHQDKISWYIFSANPSIFELRSNPLLIDILLDI